MRYFFLITPPKTWNVYLTKTFLTKLMAELGFFLSQNKESKYHFFSILKF